MEGWGGGGRAERSHSKLSYSKACLKCPLKRRPKIGFQDRLSLTAGQKYCRMLQREHSAILSTCIKLTSIFKTFVLSIFEWKLTSIFKTFVLSIFEWLLTPGFTVHPFKNWFLHTVKSWFSNSINSVADNCPIWKSMVPMLFALAIAIWGGLGLNKCDFLYQCFTSKSTIFQ